MRWLTHACRALAATLLAGACSTALAQQGAPGLDLDEWTAVDAETLDEMRGGFDIPGGLNLQLGIERVVSINGEVLSRTNVAIADVANMNASQMLMAREALGSAQLIQLGVNNFSPDDLGLPNGATLIQNSLNNQTIQTHTTITSTVNSMALLKDLNFHSTIRDGIVRSAGSL
ncbi:hypothetical protein [Telluria aromaticivorans]|uniref:Uncharacterized protein n=1 Tax=Telluria aromaticivorans TaxID=2725995 RepID=A0A7Y2P0V2_9BURK|nr:hypothetical protein [Telluria aromaticivorans]NNG23906.1 hypothetical protein [Telluria aromaticivorans]